jgi:hypothetical protein
MNLSICYKSPDGKDKSTKVFIKGIRTPVEANQLILYSVTAAAKELSTVVEFLSILLSGLL